MARGQEFPGLDAVGVRDSDGNVSWRPTADYWELRNAVETRRKTEREAARVAKEQGGQSSEGYGVAGRQLQFGVREGEAG